LKRSELEALIRQKGSYLCVGLDSDIQKLPPSYARRGIEGLYDFNMAIVEATLPYAVSYKINSAFYEAKGAKGFEQMARTMSALPHDEAFIIYDAKRGDIGNTTVHYAQAAFTQLSAHGVTVAPYMGKDSVTPFLDSPGHWAIVLGLTSNSGAADFQMLQLATGKYLFEEVISKAATWGSKDNMMFVAGATRGEQLSRVRALVPDHFLLIPGVGVQGGDLEDVARRTLVNNSGILVNVSRSIIYASNADNDFAQKAAHVAKKYQQQMLQTLEG
jgi:orotidine-5'-phosphate decarboxylase